MSFTLSWKKNSYGIHLEIFFRTKELKRTQKGGLKLKKLKEKNVPGKLWGNHSIPKTFNCAVRTVGRMSISGIHFWGWGDLISKSKVTYKLGKCHGELKPLDWTSPWINTLTEHLWPVSNVDIIHVYQIMIRYVFFFFNQRLNSNEILMWTKNSKQRQKLVLMMLQRYAFASLLIQDIFHPEFLVFIKIPNLHQSKVFSYQKPVSLSPLLVSEWQISLPLHKYPSLHCMDDALEPRFSSLLHRHHPHLPHVKVEASQVSDLRRHCIGLNVTELIFCIQN